MHASDHPDTHDALPSTGPANRWTVLAVLSAALLIVVIDVTVLHVAAPRIAEDLRPSATGLLWIVDAYPLIAAPLLVPAGALADRFGRKRLLVLGLIGFTAASVLAAFAWSPGVLIAARMLQGVAGAMIMPSTMSIIRVVFPDREERVKAIGVWSAVLAVGAAGGPVLGGFLLEHFHWGAVFLINVPVLLIVLPLALRHLPESRHSSPPPWDPPAVAAVSLGVLALAYGVKHAAREGFAQVGSAGVLLLAVALLVLFARRQLRAGQPMLELRLFARPVFAVAVFCVLLVMFALVALELFFAQYLQLVLGLGPLEASLRLVPLLAATVVGALAASKVIERFGSPRVMGAGLLASGLSLLPVFSLGTDDRYLPLALSFVVLGLSLEAALVAANDLILSSATVDEASQAASIEETAYELGGGIGVAVLGAFGAAAFTGAMPAALPGVSGPEVDQAQRSITDAVRVAAELPGAAGDALLGAARTAFVDSLHAATGLAFAVVMLCAVAAIAVARKAPVDAGADARAAVDAAADAGAAVDAAADAGAAVDAAADAGAAVDTAADAGAAVDAAAGPAAKTQAPAKA